MKGVGSLGKTKRNNACPLAKCSIRVWALEKTRKPRIIDVYGGYGKMYDQVYSKRGINYAAITGEAVAGLKKESLCDYNFFDIDPYGSPFEALMVIAQKTIGEIVIVCTDGALKRAGQIRGSIPRILVDMMGWDKSSHQLKADIYWNYPRYIKAVILKMFYPRVIKQMVLKQSCLGIGGSCSTMYFAAIIGPQANPF